MRHVRALEVAACSRDEPLAYMYGGSIHTGEWLNGLAAAQHLTGLRELALTGYTRSGRRAIQNVPWHRFCRAKHLRSLVRLDLGSGYDPDRSAELTRVIAELTNAEVEHRRVRYV